MEKGYSVKSRFGRRWSRDGCRPGKVARNGYAYKKKRNATDQKDRWPV